MWLQQTDHQGYGNMTPMTCNYLGYEHNEVSLFTRVGIQQLSTRK